MRRGIGIQSVFGTGRFGDVVGGALLAAACGSSALAGEACGNPSAGSCFMIQRTPGCSDAECCGAVCSVDPYCCSTEWDAVCRQQANDAPACGAPIPSNDSPSSPRFMTAGLQPYSTIGATDSSATTIPSSCGGVFGDTIRRDVWFEYRASVTGTVRFSTCPEPGSGAYSEFDPIIVMRDPVTLESLACNDEGFGCAGYAVLEFAVIAGERYLIQIGGHDAEIGYGAMRVTESGKPAETPENDSCASASKVALPAAGESVLFDLLGANLDDASCGSEPADVWMHVGPFAADGTARFEACSGDAAVRIEVAIGDCESARSCSGASACGADHGVTVDVEENGFALVRVASLVGVEGELSIEFTETANCPGDLNGDGGIDAADLSLVLLGWGTPAADIDGDGTTSAADLSAVLEGWGACG
ncbi:MAG: dockerin type I repeat-containing protein [Planctomycetaceae bacterium]|nr:dockerin type I repeat-containing protein [Planctomycetaceae bacterium]